MISFFISIYLKYFFILTPFFVLSTFLAMTADMNDSSRRKTAVKVMLSVMLISVILLFSGKQIFAVFGITLDSFRVGTGILLFLSAQRLINGSTSTNYEANGDIAVVPLAIPVTVGPATTGTLLVLGTEFHNMQDWIIGLSGMFCAILTVGLLLYCASYIEKLVKKQGLSILSKITGLILAAISAEMVMAGIRGFFFHA